MSDDQLPYSGLQPLTVGTSQDAAERKVGAETERQRVLEYIKSCPDGATDDAIQIALQMAGNTQRPRRVELYRMNLIRAEGTRPTHKGRQAAVWHVVTQ